MASVNWRHTFRPARLFMLDAKVSIILLTCSLYLRPWTIMIACMAIALFWYLERKGLNFDSALRALRAQFAGRIRPGKPDSKLPRAIDYERI